MLPVVEMGLGNYLLHVPYPAMELFFIYFQSLENASLGSLLYIHTVCVAHIAQ